MRYGRTVATVLGLAACAGVDRWTRGTRATRSEQQQTLAGDGLVVDPMWQATRAATIRAPRDTVWPWLVQMGYPSHRAGWYIPYWIDRLVFGVRARSANEIVQELQQLAVGDRVPDSPDGQVAYFTVAGIERNRALVLISHTHPMPVYRDVNFSWAFVLEDAGENTRLIMRARISYTPVGPARIIRTSIAAAFGIGDVVQAGAMLRGIKRRAESRVQHGTENPRALALAELSSLCRS
jgi:hypothetical protein